MNELDKREALDTTYDDVVQELSAAIEPVDADQSALDRLRAKVMQRVTGASSSVPSLVTIRSDDKAIWVQLEPGIEKKTLNINEEHGTEMFLLRVKPGTEAPGHVHDSDELCIVLEGDLSIDDLDLFAGDYHYAPKGSSHGRQSTRNGALLMLQTGYSAPA